MDESQIKDIFQAGNRVEALLKSYDWQTYIQPIFDKMVRDSIGGKTDDRFISAPENLKSMSEGELKYNLGFIEGIIQLHQKITQFIDDRDILKQQIEEASKLPAPSELSKSPYDMTDELIG